METDGIACSEKGRLFCYTLVTVDLYTMLMVLNVSVCSEKPLNHASSPLHDSPRRINEAVKCVTSWPSCLVVARGCVLEFAFGHLGVMTTQAS